MSPNADDDELDASDSIELWEYQVHPLTVGRLRESLGELPDGLPVRVEFWDGAEARILRPVHIDLLGSDEVPSAIVITVS